MIQLLESDIKQLTEYVSNHRNITLITHTNPDGDTIGAALALGNLLAKFDKNINVIIPDELPDFLTWLPSSVPIINYTNFKVEAQKALQSADIVFCMDFNAPHRTGKFSRELEKLSVPKILIDHHLFPDTEFFDLMFSFTESSSTSELLFHIVEAAGWQSLIDNSIATSLFVGIMTDTGSFAHSCDRKEVFEVTAKLIEYGDLKVKSIHDRIFNNFKENRLRFLGYCISNKLVVRYLSNTAYITVTLDEMKEFNVSEGDLEGIVNYALSIEGIELAVLFKEKEESIKLSFRSKSIFNVNQFARQYFEGGGHFNAAGGKSYSSMNDSVNFFESLISKIEI